MNVGKDDNTFSNPYKNKGKSEDWDLDYLQYCWYTILKRTESFWEQTPKYLFLQLDIHKKVNGLDKEKEQQDKQVEWI